MKILSITKQIGLKQNETQRLQINDLQDIHYCKQLKIS